MLGIDRDDVEARQLQHARDAAEKYAATVLLKGRHTLIADPDGRVRVTTTGTPWLATAGAGDVLGGLIGALLAAGLLRLRRRLGRLLAARSRGDPRRPRRPAGRRRRGERHPGGGGRHPLRPVMEESVPMTSIARAEIVVDVAAIRHNVAG